MLTTIRSPRGDEHDWLRISQYRGSGDRPLNDEKPEIAHHFGCIGAGAPGTLVLPGWRCSTARTRLRAYSLQTVNFTGKSKILGTRRQVRRPRTEAIQPFCNRFPARICREIRQANRVDITTLRGIWACLRRRLIVSRCPSALSRVRRARQSQPIYSRGNHVAYNAGHRIGPKQMPASPAARQRNALMFVIREISEIQRQMRGCMRGEFGQP